MDSDRDREPDKDRDPRSSPEGAAASEPPPPAPAASLKEAMRRHRARLLAIDGVQGVDRGRTDDGTDVIRVHIRDESARRNVPRELDGHPVTAIVTGTFKAY